ncbi:DoxX family protein [Candidatus Pacearchaeota archaeon]|nr:DoxX family protein [Candidatus Pacearchaeota archaeon]
MKNLNMVNRILLGLVMLVPGLLKLLVVGPSGVAKMTGGIFLFSWAPMLWAWILIFSEILFGIAILANYQTKYTAWPPVVILSVAVLFVTVKWMNLAGTSWSSVLLHLIALWGFVMIGCENCKKH